MFYHGKKALFLLFFALSFMSCGKNSVKVTKVTLEERIDPVTEKIWIDVKTQLSMGNTSLPALKLPVNYPGKGLVGTLELGADFVAVGLNLTELLKLRAYQAVLPNGEPLPLISDNEVVILEAGAGKKIKIYLTLTATSKAVGLSIPIAEIDKLGAELNTPSKYFQPFQLGGTTVMAGFYWSPEAGKNGLGVFVDLGPIFSRLMLDGYWVESYDIAQGSELDTEAMDVDGDTYNHLSRFMRGHHKRRTKFKVKE
ncbi:MAG: hypothetical protein QE271_07605 [Bacteriovoracaceae bacterium]|nr:hypothetical protein [Bacteriovoracaceae bacterium]